MRLENVKDLDRNWSGRKSDGKQLDWISIRLENSGWTFVGLKEKIQTGIHSKWKNNIGKYSILEN